MINPIQFFLNQDARGIVLIRVKNTTEIALIHALKSKMTCIVNDPKCRETRKLIATLIERGAAVLSSDEVGRRGCGLSKTSQSSPAPRGAARKVDAPRRRRAA